MNTGRSLRRLSALLSVTASLAAPAYASAANTVNISNSEPVEDTAYQVEYSGTSDGFGTLDATIKPAGGRPCAATPGTDDGRDITELNTVQGSYAETFNVTSSDSGDYLLCAWLRPSGGGQAIIASKQIKVRQPNSTGSVVVPASVRGDTVFQVGITVQTEVGRSIDAELNGPGVTCGANPSANTGIAEILDGRFNQGGPTTYTSNETAPQKPGVYTVCAWVLDSSSVVPEAAFSGQFTITPSVACERAQGRIVTYTRSFAKHKKLYRKYSKAWKKARGAKRRKLKSKARRERNAMTSAQSRLANARSAATNECS
jgi:hypothetical protein